MRRFFTPLILAFSLFAAQHAGFVHGIGHDASRLSSTGSVLAFAQSHNGGESSDDSTYCDKCIQFAHVAGAASATPLTWHVGQVASEQPFALAATPGAAQLRAFQSRAPPKDL